MPAQSSCVNIEGATRGTQAYRCQPNHLVSTLKKQHEEHKPTSAIMDDYATSFKGVTCSDETKTKQSEATTPSIDDITKSFAFCNVRGSEPTENNTVELSFPYYDGPDALQHVEIERKGSSERELDSDINISSNECKVDIKDRTSSLHSNFDYSDESIAKMTKSTDKRRKSWKSTDLDSVHFAELAKNDVCLEADNSYSNLFTNTPHRSSSNCDMESVSALSYSQVTTTDAHRKSGDSDSPSHIRSPLINADTSCATNPISRYSTTVYNEAIQTSSPRINSQSREDMNSESSINATQRTNEELSSFCSMKQGSPMAITDESPQSPLNSDTRSCSSTSSLINLHSDPKLNTINGGGNKETIMASELNETLFLQENTLQNRSPFSSKQHNDTEIYCDTQASSGVSANAHLDTNTSQFDGAGPNKSLNNGSNGDCDDVEYQRFTHVTHCLHLDDVYQCYRNARLMAQRITDTTAFIRNKVRYLTSKIWALAAHRLLFSI